MIRQWACAAALAGVSLVSGTSNVAAHARGGRSAIVVQAEDGAAAVLVSFTLPSGPHSTLYLTTAALHEPLRPLRNVVTDLMTEQVIRSLTMYVNGVPADIDSVDSTFTSDSSSLGQHTVHVLLNVKVPAGPSTLWVSASTSVETRLTWTNKTHSGSATAPIPQGQWRSADIPLTITWPHDQPSPTP